MIIVGTEEEIKHATKRVRDFLTKEPLYVRDRSEVVGRITTELAEGRADAMLIETLVDDLMRGTEIVLGLPEHEGVCDDVRFPPKKGLTVRRVIWVQ